MEPAQFTDLVATITRRIAGPHHRHPNGEIDLVMPIDGNARSRGRPRHAFAFHR